jgi:predicted ATPase
MSDKAHPIPRSLFVGRHREIDLLSEALQHAMTVEGCMVMLVGEPGIGKTRTAEEFSRRASAQSIDVFWGRCYEGEGAPPYWSWIQVIRALLDRLDPDELRSYMGSGISAIAEMVPRVAEVLNDLPPLQRIDDPVSARFRIFDATAGFLKRATQKRPIVIILDDLHWSDGASLLLLEFLAHQLADMRLLIIGTYRDVDVKRTHPLQQTLGDLTRERMFEKILLRGLAADEVNEYVDASATAGSESIGETVYTQSEGNPLFMTETIRLFADERRMGMVAERGSMGNRVPDGIREVIGRRLSGLSVSCNTMLTTASIVGREFS